MAMYLELMSTIRVERVWRMVTIGVVDLYLREGRLSIRPGIKFRDDFYLSCWTGMIHIFNRGSCGRCRHFNGRLWDGTMRQAAFFFLSNSKVQSTFWSGCTHRYDLLCIVILVCWLHLICWFTILQISWSSSRLPTPMEARSCHWYLIALRSHLIFELWFTRMKS